MILSKKFPEIFSTVFLFESMIFENLWLRVLLFNLFFISQINLNSFESEMKW